MATASTNNEFFEALAALEKERGLPEDYLIEKIKAAIVIAVKKDYNVEDDNVIVDIDPSSAPSVPRWRRRSSRRSRTPTPRSAWRTPSGCAKATRSARSFDPP